MKTVLIMRHAKSSWEHQGLSDYQRPLNSRGLKDAPLMAKHINAKNIIPEIAYSSDSARTTQTLEFLSEEFKNMKTEFDSSLYLADAEDLCSRIQSADDKFNTILILAHNPGVTELVYKLSRINLDNIPTAGVCCMKFDVQSFSHIKKGEGELEYFIYPKMN